MRILLIAASALALVACTTDDNDAGEVGIPAGETGGVCGGYNQVECLNEGDYCHEPDGQCAVRADGEGVCRKKPQVCTEPYRPVCGCDDVTYDNACKAAAAGVSIASAGPCVEGS